MFKRLIIVSCLWWFLNSALYASVREQPAAESDQQINDFSLAGYGEQGKKTWDISGKSADIFGDVIKLKNIIGNMYGRQEDIKLTADKGDFNKAEGRVHVEQNVVITTSTGGRMTTDSLDWDRKNQIVSTKDMVNIEKDGMVTTAQGAVGKPNLSAVTLEKDVKVEMYPKATQSAAAPEKKKGEDKMVITCDGPLQIDYEKNIATFNNNVKVDRTDSQIYSDTMDVYFVSEKNAQKTDAGAAPALMGNKIDKIVCRGNVRIVRGENVSYSDEAVYSAADKKITLKGSPKLVIYSSEDLKGLAGQ